MEEYIKIFNIFFYTDFLLFLFSGNDMRTDIVETPASMTQAPTPATSVPGTVTMADMQRAMSMFQQQVSP